MSLTQQCSAPAMDGTLCFRHGCALSPGEQQMACLFLSLFFLEMFCGVALYLTLCSTFAPLHQGDHRFWLRDEATQTAARSYLTMRHSLAPSLISAGQTLQKQGFPLTARCDLLWPTHTEASDPTQCVVFTLCHLGYSDVGLFL